MKTSHVAIVGLDFTPMRFFTQLALAFGWGFAFKVDWRVVNYVMSRGLVPLDANTEANRRSVLVLLVVTYVTTAKLFNCHKGNGELLGVDFAGPSLHRHVVCVWVCLGASDSDVNQYAD